MPYNNKAFGIVIGGLRSQKGLTQARMAELAGIAPERFHELNFRALDYVL